jgi:hypothetical protein
MLTCRPSSMGSLSHQRTVACQHHVLCHLRGFRTDQRRELLNWLLYQLKDRWGDQIGWMGVNQIFAAKHWKWALQFNWNEVNAQTKITSTNQLSLDFKMFIILTQDQQNKRNSNPTTKSLNRSKTCREQVLISLAWNYVLGCETEPNELWLKCNYTQTWTNMFSRSSQTLSSIGIVNQPQI